MSPDFQRSDKSAAEIAAVPALGTTECMAHVRMFGGAFEAETLVHLLRRCLAKQDSVLFEMCGRLLIGREEADGRWHGGHCEGIIVNLACSFGFNRNREAMREFRAGCHGALWREVSNGRPFWEVRFGRAFRMKCIDVARSQVRKQTAAEDEEDALAAMGGSSADTDDLPDPTATAAFGEVVARLSSAAHEAVLLAAIRHLPKRQARAAFLAWVEGRAIEGTGGNSVESLMGITARRVYMLLAKARVTLQADPAIRAIWFGEA